jgi:hypothetical protein
MIWTGPIWHRIETSGGVLWTFGFIKMLGTSWVAAQLADSQEGAKLRMQVSKYSQRQESAVGLATGYGLDDRGVGARVLIGSRIVCSPRRPDRLWGPPNLLSNVYLGLLPRVLKRMGHEADHSFPASAEFKKTWIYMSTPSYAFMA